MHYIAPIPIIIGVVGVVAGLLWLVAAGSDEDGGPDSGLFFLFGATYIGMRVLRATGQRADERPARLRHPDGVLGDDPVAARDLIGSRPAASTFLNGRRKELSKPQIRLARHFKMDAGYFLYGHPAT